jgi:hypothetical protein
MQQLNSRNSDATIEPSTRRFFHDSTATFYVWYISGILLGSLEKLLTI